MIQVGVCCLLLLLAASGCLPGDGTNNEIDPAGFFSGIWHGWIAPIALVVGFFHRAFASTKSTTRVGGMISAIIWPLSAVLVGCRFCGAIKTEQWH